MYDDYDYDDGYGAGCEGTFMEGSPCPRCGCVYRRDNFSIQTGRHYIVCANCELRLLDLGNGEPFSKPYKAFGPSSGMHDRGYSFVNQHVL